MKDTLSSKKEIVFLNGSLCYKSLNWTYLYRVDVFLHFWVLIQILKLISVKEHCRVSLFLNYNGHIVLKESVCFPQF